MTIHRIPSEYVKSTNRRRQIFMGSLAFAGLIAASIYLKRELTFSNIGFCAVTAAFFGWGRHKLTWVPFLKEEAEWELETMPNSLRFKHNKTTSEIVGTSIEKLRVKRTEGQVNCIDVTYNDGQVTRIQYYEGMDAIFMHLRKISSPNVTVEDKD